MACDSGRIAEGPAFDRDAKYGLEVQAAVRSMAMRPIRTSFQSPWQNGVAERWIESCRRDLLDHGITFNERHLKRLLSDDVRYYKRVSYYPTSLCG
jgi:putative transposase